MTSKPQARDARRPEAPSPKAPGDARDALLLRPVRIAVLVGALALLAHFVSIWNGFVFDDHREIEHNRALREPFSLGTLMRTEYWGSGQTGWYRPVPLIAQKIVFDLFGVDPRPYHALVLAVHVTLAALLAWTLASRFALPRGALLAGALFAVHTVHTETVSTAYGLKEALAALLSFAALALVLGGREAAPWGRLARVFGGGLLVGLAILSKESAAPVPAALFAADLLRGAPFQSPLAALRRNGRTALLHGAFYATAAFGAVSMRFPVVGKILERTALDAVTNPVVALEQPQRLAMALKIAALYGRMLVWPVPFAVSYATGAVTPPRSLFAPGVLVGAALVGGLAAAVLLCWRLRPPGGLGAVWAGATYLLASNLVFPFSTMMSERFLYLPSLGLALLLAPSADRWMSGTNRGALRPDRRAAVAAAALAIAALTILTLRRAPVYGDDLTLTVTTARWYRGGAIQRLTSADELTRARRFDEAEAALLRMREEHPGLPRVDEHLAMNAEAAGDDDAARTYWELSIRHPAADVGTYQAYAELLLRAGETDEAIRQLSAGIRTGTGAHGNMARTRQLRARLLLARGNSLQAVTDLRVAAAVNPEDLSILEDLSSALERRADDAGAEEALRRALAADPDRRSALARLGRFYLARGRGEEAIPLLDRLVVLDPGDLRARSDLGTACMQAQRHDQARGVFEEILARDPDHLVALATLGSLEQSAGRTPQALALYRRYLAAHPPENSLTADVRSRALLLERGR